MMIPRHNRRAFLGLACSSLVAASLSPALAVEVNEDGLPLPRFASTRSAPINVRVGPGVRYDVAWIYNKPDMPVEITAEFDIWRKIRDFDGSEGWVQQNLLSGSRTGLVSPWKKDTFPLLASASDGAPARAYLPSGFRVDIRRCDGSWCQVDAAGEDASGRKGTYTGYLKQSDIWGAYQGEKF
ncbi:MAG TPA: SH3 domain-containing protein [Devosiaceae bacterium]|jgi:SH3-like domain-containing protein|nr:SH3 domain-containing protein [Devosiaceae bacterium]